MSEFLASLSTQATPQGGRAAKRKKAGEGGSKEDEEDPTTLKLLLLTTQLLLTDQRNTASRIGTTMIIPAQPHQGLGGGERGVPEPSAGAGGREGNGTPVGTAPLDQHNGLV
jgi:hypothetical protein